MTARFEQLDDAEREWVASRIETAKLLVAALLPAAGSRPLDCEILDRAWAAFLSGGETDPRRVDTVINAVGSAFGQCLVDELGFAWVVATDDYGSDLAVRALPGEGDVLIYPRDVVAKRWETRTVDFLVPLREAAALRVRELRSS